MHDIHFFKKLPIRSPSHSLELPVLYLLLLRIEAVVRGMILHLKTCEAEDQKLSLEITGTVRMLQRDWEDMQAEPRLSHSDLKPDTKSSHRVL